MDALYEITFNAPVEFTRGFIMGIIVGKNLTGKMMLIPDKRAFTSGCIGCSSNNRTCLLIEKSLFSNLSQIVAKYLEIESIRRIKSAQFSFFFSSNLKDEKTVVNDFFTNLPLGVNVHYFQTVDKTENEIDLNTSISECNLQGIIEGNSSSIINFYENLIEKCPKVEIGCIRLESESEFIVYDDYCF